MAVRNGRIHVGLDDRTREYREWRYGLGSKMYVLDVDQIEWRKTRFGGIAPVGLLELKRFDTDGPVRASMLADVLDPLEERFQGEACRRVAAALGVPAWLVVYRHDLTGFWVYNLTERRGWFPLDDPGGRGYTAEQYGTWLRGLEAT